MDGNAGHIGAYAPEIAGVCPAGIPAGMAGPKASGRDVGLDPFPIYTRAEFAADRIVHVVGLTTAVVALVWLLGRVPASTGAVQVAALWIYAAGLFGMLAASAAYNLVPPSPLKAELRRVDRCMIFVMIAGTYTPFVLGAMPRHLGVPLWAAVWSLGLLGIVLEYAAPRLARRLSLPLYLGMGWLIVGVLPSLLAAVGLAPFLLLVAGGIVYSLGTALQAHGRLLFHNAVWHVMVAVAAGLHFTAIVLLPPTP